MEKITNQDKKQETANSYLAERAGALSRPSHKIRVPPTYEGTGTNNGLIIRAELPARSYKTTA